MPRCHRGGGGSRNDHDWTRRGSILLGCIYVRSCFVLCILREFSVWAATLQIFGIDIYIHIQVLVQIFTNKSRLNTRGRESNVVLCMDAPKSNQFDSNRLKLIRFERFEIEWLLLLIFNKFSLIIPIATLLS